MNSGFFESKWTVRSLTRPQLSLVKKNCKTQGTMRRRKGEVHKESFGSIFMIPQPESTCSFVKFYLKLNPIQQYKVPHHPGLTWLTNKKKKSFENLNAVRML